MGTSKLLWGQPDKMLGGNLLWTGIPSRGSTNTPGAFMPQNPEISAGVIGLLVLPFSIGGRLNLPLPLSQKITKSTSQFYNVIAQWC